MEHLLFCTDIPFLSTFPTEGYIRYRVAWESEKSTGCIVLARSVDCSIQLCHIIIWSDDEGCPRIDDSIKSEKNSLSINTELCACRFPKPLRSVDVMKFEWSIVKVLVCAPKEKFRSRSRELDSEFILGYGVLLKSILKELRHWNES